MFPAILFKRLQKIMGSHLKGCNVSTLQSVQLVWIYFVAGRSPATSNTTVLCLCEGGWCKRYALLVKQ